MKKTLLLLALSILIVACSSDSKDPILPEDQVPITNLKLPETSSTPIKQGDPVLIEGKGFTQASQIWLRNAAQKAQAEIQAEIIKVTAESISFTAPDVYGKQELLLKQSGKEYLLGELTFLNEGGDGNGDGNGDSDGDGDGSEPTAEKYLYASKYYYNEDPAVSKIVRINPLSGEEIIITTLDPDKDFETNPVYSVSTHEMIGVLEGNVNALLKLDMTTGNTTVVALDQGNDRDYYSLTIDDNDNLYAFKRYYGDTDINQIVKIDPLNGQETLVATLDLNGNSGNYYDDLVYCASTHEIIGLPGDNKSLLKVDLTTGNSTVIALDQGDDRDYYSLVIDDNDNLYAFKRHYADTRINQIVKINPLDGQETLIATLNWNPNLGSYYDCLVYDSNAEEIIGLPDSSNALLKVNTKTGVSTWVSLDQSDDVAYNRLVFGL